RRHGAGRGDRPSRRAEHEEEGNAQPDPLPARDGNEQARFHFRKLVSYRLSRFAGTCLITPISSNSAAASLLKAWISPAKNLALAARSAHLSLDCEASNCSGVCFTSAPMIVKALVLSAAIMSSAWK